MSAQPTAGEVIGALATEVARLRAALEAIASPSGKTIQMAEGIARSALDGGER